MNRIEKKFKELKRKNKKAFIAFITAGYPNLKITESLVRTLEKSGVDILELGVPFSDPMADGPTIQQASAESLKRKVNLKSIFDLVRRSRKFTQIPICLMSYFNPIYAFGKVKFLKACLRNGVDGVIIPDLPPEEDREFITAAAKMKIDVICFLSPTSPVERILYISSISKGFIYYVSLTGVTGARSNLPADLVSRLKQIKKLTAKPVCAGFGISNRRQVRQLSAVCDGVIVGSAIVAKIRSCSGRLNLVKQANKFVQALSS